jgi:hypothetical protein
MPAPRPPAGGTVRTCRGPDTGRRAHWAALVARDGQRCGGRRRFRSSRRRECRGRVAASQRGQTRRTASACRPDSGWMSVQSTCGWRPSCERCSGRPHRVWLVPGIQACTSPAGRRTRSGSVQVLDAATAYLMARPCPMPEASAQRAIVVAPSSPHAPLVSGPSPDPFAPTLERGWRSSAGRKRRALYTQDQVGRQLSAKPCQILPKGVVPDYGLAGPRDTASLAVPPDRLATSSMSSIVLAGYARKGLSGRSPRSSTGRLSIRPGRYCGVAAAAD